MSCSGLTATTNSEPSALRFPYSDRTAAIEEGLRPLINDKGVIPGLFGQPEAVLKKAILPEDVKKAVEEAVLGFLWALAFGSEVGLQPQARAALSSLPFPSQLQVVLVMASNSVTAAQAPVFLNTYFN